MGGEGGWVGGFSDECCGTPSIPACTPHPFNHSYSTIVPAQKRRGTPSRKRPPPQKETLTIPKQEGEVSSLASWYSISKKASARLMMPSLTALYTLKLSFTTRPRANCGT